MKVMRNSGAGRASQVEADVETLGLVLGVQSEFAALRELQQFVEFLGLRVTQKGNVAVEYDKNVSGSVREEVEYYEGVLPSMEHQIIAVPILGQDPAEDAALVCVGSE